MGSPTVQQLHTLDLRTDMLAKPTCLCTFSNQVCQIVYLQHRSQRVLSVRKVEFEGSTLRCASSRYARRIRCSQRLAIRAAAHSVTSLIQSFNSHSARSHQLDSHSSDSNQLASHSAQPDQLRLVTHATILSTVLTTHSAPSNHLDRHSA